MERLLSLTSEEHALAARWRALQDGSPSLDVAEAARLLDVSEAELVASACGDRGIRLLPPFGDVVRLLPVLGSVRAVTRNAHADIETRGVYPAPDAGCAGAVGQIGARFFIERWCYGYVLDEPEARGGQRSLRFFDARGRAVHEIHVEPESDWRAVARLVDLFASFDQSPGEEVVVASPLATGPGAPTGHRLRGAEQARPVSPAALATVLDGVLVGAIAVSLAVRSAGVVQRYSGLVRDVRASGPWLVVTAPLVRVRVQPERIAEAWVVSTPSLDGPTISLELLDATANVLVSVSGARWPGIPESPAWRDLLEDLQTVF